MSPRRWIALLAFVSALLSLHFPGAVAASGSGVRLIRTFKTDEAVSYRRSAAISANGKTFAILSRKRVQSGDRHSGAEFLTVYESDSGAQLRQLIPGENETFGEFEFTSDHKLSFRDFKYDPNSETRRQFWTDWDLNTDTRSQTQLPDGDQFSPMCRVDRETFLGEGTLNRSRHESPLVVWSLAKTTELSPRFDKNQAGRTWAVDCLSLGVGRQIIKVNYTDGKLWVVSPGEPPIIRPCGSFPNAHIQGFAVSPDHSQIAVSTWTGQMPQPKIVLHILRAANCEALKSFELSFPERYGYKSPLFAPSKKSYDNYPFGDQMAKLLSISPDNTKLALAFGIGKNYDGVAYFGVYSLKNGQRLATLEGDKHQGGLWWALTHNSDETEQTMAPISGILQFSADSKALFASSKYLRVWDISILPN